MCTVKELKEYLSGLPEDTEVYVMQEVMDSTYSTYTSEQPLNLLDELLMDYYEEHNQLLLGGYA
jgi:hypothetical protein